MRALMRSILRYENSSLYEKAEAAHSLRRYKLSPTYRLQLRRAILDADDAEQRAHTDLEKRKIRLCKIEAQTELEHLQAGGSPSAVTGLIALRIWR